MTTTKEQKQIQTEFKNRMDEGELLNCMRCGFCLPSCPTYIESGFQESHSPRGRIALMKAVTDGLIEPDEDVERSLSLCLGCRACEPVFRQESITDSCLKKQGISFIKIKNISRACASCGKQHLPGFFPIKTVCRQRRIFLGYTKDQDCRPPSEKPVCCAFCLSICVQWNKCFRPSRNGKT